MSRWVHARDGGGRGHDGKPAKPADADDPTDFRAGPDPAAADTPWHTWQLRKQFLLNALRHWDGHDEKVHNMAWALVGELPDHELNDPDESGRTPLMNACHGHAEDVVFRLCDRHPDLLHRDEWGATAQHLVCVAASDSSPAILQALYDEGVDQKPPTPRDDPDGAGSGAGAGAGAGANPRSRIGARGRPPADDEEERFRPVEGAWPPTDSIMEVDARDVRGCTPLHYAAACGDLETMKWLSFHGADASYRDNDGARPLEYALQFCGLTEDVDHMTAHIPDALKDMLTWVKETTRVSEAWVEYWKQNEWVWHDPPLKSGVPPYLWSRRTGKTRWGTEEELEAHLEDLRQNRLAYRAKLKALREANLKAKAERKRLAYEKWLRARNAAYDFMKELVRVRYQDGTVEDMPHEDVQRILAMDKAEEARRAAGRGGGAADGGDGRPKGLPEIGLEDYSVTVDPESDSDAEDEVAALIKSVSNLSGVTGKTGPVKPKIVRRNRVMERAMWNPRQPGPLAQPFIGPLSVDTDVAAARAAIEAAASGRAGETAMAAVMRRRREKRDKIKDLIESLIRGEPLAGDPQDTLRNGYPEYTRRQALMLSHLSVYWNAGTDEARRALLEHVCELANDPPPDKNLGSEDFDGVALITDRVNKYARIAEEFEEAMRKAEEDARQRRRQRMLDMQRKDKQMREERARQQQELAAHAAAHAGDGGGGGGAATGK